MKTAAWALLFAQAPKEEREMAKQSGSSNAENIILDISPL
jgi:hypothetical protein